MPQTLARFDNGTTARISTFLDTGHALYAFDDGKILVTPAHYGQPDRHAVTITLGRPGDRSGYGLTGLRFGDWLLTGTLTCVGHGFTPKAHTSTPDKNPLDDVSNPDARQAAADHLSQIASHFFDLIAPGIRR
ncbi:hypothetical protein G3M53_07515 [Streptomyces sp. SID7982]|uniref:hypothetical protein n=1 Tax=Streptomyces diastaticus TaxID=1956 RepID=UPI0013C285BC|nr:hypothetical protein [Streptomyces sp. SID7982]